MNLWNYLLTHPIIRVNNILPTAGSDTSISWEKTMKLVAEENNLVKNNEQKCHKDLKMCRSITEWASAFIYDEYLQRTMTLKKPIIAPGLGCKMGHLSHNLLWLQFHRKRLWMFDSKPTPSAFCQDSTLTQYKNAVFREAAHARNLLINGVPEHFLWWMELVSKLLLTNLSQNDYELFFYFSNWLNISAVQYNPTEHLLHS